MAETIEGLDAAEAVLAEKRAALKAAEAAERSVLERIKAKSEELRGIGRRSHEAKVKAALEGSPVSDAGEGFAADALREEISDLRYELWGAQVRRLEAALEEAHARVPVGELRLKAAGVEHDRTKQAIREAEDAEHRARLAYGSASAFDSRARRDTRKLRNEIAQLRERGPEQVSA
jgi:chromosome segregation ATPase